MNVLDLASKRVQLKKAASTHGGEWWGPCPACKEGTNRFHVWPAQNDGKGAYWCRHCGVTGDNIQFLRDFEGMSYHDACAYLNIPVPDAPAPPRQRSAPERPSFEPNTHQSPADLWMEKAEKFLTWSQETLAKNTEVLSWLSERGINAEAVKTYRLGWNPGEKGKDLFRPRKSWGLPEIVQETGKPKMLWLPRGLVIPYLIDGVVQRLRIRRPEGEPRYYVIPGSSMAIMILGYDRRAFVVIEAELDAIAVVTSQHLAGAAAMGSSSAKPDAVAYDILKKSLQILNALDYDKAGASAAKWWSEQFPQHERWPVPKGKDPGEAVRLGIALDRWILAGLPPALTIGDRDELIEKPSRRTERTEKGPDHGEKRAIDEFRLEPPPMDTVPAAVRELHELLSKNPRVKIINTADRFTVLRDGRYVSGRINELVFRTPVVVDYIATHPAPEITAQNLII